MKVLELIEKLKACDPDMDVCMMWETDRLPENDTEITVGNALLYQVNGRDWWQFDISDTDAIDRARVFVCLCERAFTEVSLPTAMEPLDDQGATE